MRPHKYLQLYDKDLAKRKRMSAIQGSRYPNASLHTAGGIKSFWFWFSVLLMFDRDSWRDSTCEFITSVLAVDWIHASVLNVQQYHRKLGIRPWLTAMLDHQHYCRPVIIAPPPPPRESGKQDEDRQKMGLIDKNNGLNLPLALPALTCHCQMQLFHPLSWRNPII